MPDDVGGHEGVALSGLGQVEGAQQRAVTTVAQKVHGVLDGDPAHFVDLTPGTEPATHHVHQPVAGDLLASLMVRMGGAAERRHQLATETGLFSPLATRGRLERLTAIDFAFRERPVVIAGPVDDGPPHRPACTVAPDDPPRRSYKLGLID